MPRGRRRSVISEPFRTVEVGGSPFPGIRKAMPVLRSLTAGTPVHQSRKASETIRKLTGPRGLLVVLGVLLVISFATPTAVFAEQPVYRMGAGDRLRVIVFGEEDLSGEFDVDGTGSISMPLIGEIRAKSLSLRQLERSISKKFLDGYLKNPRINVEVLNYRNFFILGEVKKPGGYPFVNGITILEAVALGGGYTYRAKKSEIMITRANSPNRNEKQVPETAVVLPGDTIRVPERFF